MHNHWDQHLNLKALILARRPQLVVECGAGNGEMTRLLASMLDVYKFRLCVISDYPIEGIDERVEWISGLSYNAIKTFSSQSIDLCIIDTDHNYWTLMKEFEALFDRVKEGGLIALHDVETFYHDSGMALKYSNGEPYPLAEIEKYAPYGGVGDAMIEFLFLKKMNYKLVSFTTESQGAALIERKTCPKFSIMVPGPEPAYSK